MNLELSDDIQAFCDSIARCFADRAPIASYVREHIDAKRWEPDLAWTQLAEIGATGVVVPTGCGGLGLGLTEAVFVAEAAGRALYPGPWFTSAVVSARMILATQANDVGNDLLARIADGSMVVAAALLDPLATAWELPAAHTQGNDHVISCNGLLVMGANAASVILVPADGPDGLGVYAVRKSSDADVTRQDSVDPTADVAVVRLTNAAAVLVGPASEDILRKLSLEALVVGLADAVGAAQAVLDLAVAYATVRHQFGRAIGSFQAVQHLCVDMLETIELARSGVLHAAWAADVGDAAARIAALRLKSFSDRLATVGDQAIQVFGGIGFTWEHDSHLYLKRLLGWSALFGPSWAYRREVGKQLLDSVMTSLPVQVGRSMTAPT